MKLSFKIILPIILISALLILLAGCFGVPADEEPGYTPGTITGIIAAPCCSTSADQVSAPSGVSPEYWCFYCKKPWNLQNKVEVILTYGLEEIATVFTDVNGKYTFTNVAPGKNYVITALCPEYDDDQPLVKDVATEVVEGKTFNAKITDCISTSLGLVVDYLVENTTVLGPEDIVLDGVIAGIPNFYGFPRFKKLVEEVCRVSENCGNLTTDEDVQDALCWAAEEIGRKVIPDLDLGCGPGYTPGPGPGPIPLPCDGNTTDPVINKVTLDDGDTVSTFLSPPSTIDLVAGKPYEVCVYATDDDGILSPALTYSLTIDDGTNPPFDIDIGTSDSGSICFPVPPLFGVVGTYEVYVNVSDGCVKIPWGPVTVVVGCPVLEKADIDIDTIGPLCQNECATISSVTVTHADGTSVIAYNDDNLEWFVPTGISFDPTSSNQVCLTEDPVLGGKTYTIDVTYTDECEETVDGSVDVSFEDCTPPCESAELWSLVIITNHPTQYPLEYIDLVLAEETYDEIVVGQNVNHIWIKVSAECGDVTTIEFNYYRGGDPQCGGTWYSGYAEENPNPLSDPLEWLSTSPADTDPKQTLKSDDVDWFPNYGNTPGLFICNNGGNILKIKVTNGVVEKVYTVLIDRTD